MSDTCLILDNIRSTHNVGSIFRTAETLAITKIYCVGTTPAPIDRFGRKRADIAKVSLGAEEIIPWEHVDDGSVLIKKLHKAGYTIVALEQHEHSVDYKTFCPEGKAAIILGNEVGGVSPALLELADTIMEIPMKGTKESLNVSVAAGIALYRLLDVD